MKKFRHGYTESVFPIEERIKTFWERTDVKSDSECWNFKGKPDKQTGYCRYSYNKGNISCHRFAWFITNGEIPKGMCVCHKCDNKTCVNPKHLFLGTLLDNIDDMIKKGRNVPPVSIRHITEDEVRKIRELWVPYKMSARMISRLLNLPEISVNNALKPDVWKCVPWTRIRPLTRPEKYTS